MKHSECGVTLLEMMVAVSIVAILVAIMVPGMAELFEMGNRGLMSWIWSRI